MTNNPASTPVSVKDEKERDKLLAAGLMAKKGYLWPPMPDERYTTGSLQKYGSRTHGCQITIYPEQVPCTEDEITAHMRLGIADRNHAIMEIMGGRIRKVSREDFFVTAMIHDNDVKVSEGSFYTSKVEKIHMHINVIPGQNQDKNRKFYLSKALDVLGIKLRFPEDDWLILEGGIQSIRDQQQAILYLMHDTAQSRREGKTPYEFDAMISNYSEDEVMDFIKGAALMNGRRKATISDWENLAETAKIAGRDDFRKSPVRELQSVLDEFVEHYTGIFTDFRDKAPKWKQVVEEYKRSWRIEKEQYENDRQLEEGNKINRVAVFISGPPNAGKTTTAFLAIKRLLKMRYSKASQTDLERMIAKVNNSANGNLDNVDIYTEAIIFDDSGCRETGLLALADQSPVSIHRRYTNKTFCGDYLILTSNCSFHDYVKYYWDTCRDTEIEAISTRIFRCHTDDRHQLVLDMAGTFQRGNDADAADITAKFGEFLAMYNKISAAYWGVNDTTTMQDKPTEKGEWRQETLDGFMAIPDDVEVPFTK